MGKTPKTGFKFLTLIFDFDFESTIEPLPAYISLYDLS